jgi:hypothetical protein
MTKKTMSILSATALAMVMLTTPVFTSIDDAITNMQRYLDKANEYGFRLPEGGRGRAWWAWDLTPGYHYQVDRTFYRGNDYLLVAAGDSRVTDVDIKVFDENWNLIASDTDATALAVVRYTPRWSGTFHVRTIYYRGAVVGSLGFFIAFKR